MGWYIVFLLILGSTLGEVSLNNLNSFPIPSIDDFEVIKERCEVRGGPGTYDKIKKAKTVLLECITDRFDFAQIQTELEESMKTGSMEEVFGKYCAKRSEVKACVASFTDTLKLCLDENEKDAMNLTLHIAEELGEFACYRDGDRMAMFIAEGGVECIKEHTDGIQNCVNKTFKLGSSDPTTNSLSAGKLDKEKCNKIGHLQTCIVEELEKCEETTPANVVDSLFKFIKKHACKSPQRKRSIFKRSIFANNYLPDALRAQAMQQFEEYCSKYGKPDSFEKLKESIEEVQGCMNRLRINQTISPMTLEDTKEKMHKCINPILDYASDCFPENQKFLAEFYKQSVDSTIEFTYKHQNDLKDVAFNQEMLNCFQTFKHDENKAKKLKDCVTNSNLMEQKLENVTKSMLCKALDDVKKCINNSIKEVCIRDISIQQIIDEFGTAISSPCKNYTIILTS